MLGLGQGIYSAGAVSARPDPNIAVHLDAMLTDTIQITGGKVHAWLGVNGVNSAVQTIEGSKPVLGTAFSRPGVKFDATDDYMVAPFTYDWTNNPFTVLVVATKLASTGFKGIIGNRFPSTPASWWTLGQDDPSNMVVERTSGDVLLTYGFNAQSQPPQIYEFAHNPGASTDTIYRNGTLATSQATVANIGGVSNELRIGNWVVPTQSLDGLIHEVIVRVDLLNPTQRAAFVASAAAKWQ